MLFFLRLILFAYAYTRCAAIRETGSGHVTADPETLHTNILLVNVNSSEMNANDFVSELSKVSAAFKRAIRMREIRVPRRPINCSSTHSAGDKSDLFWISNQYEFVVHALGHKERTIRPSRTNCGTNLLGFPETVAPRVSRNDKSVFERFTRQFPRLEAYEIHRKRPS